MNPAEGQTYSDPEQYPDYKEVEDATCDFCDGYGEIDYGDDSSHDWIECPQCNGEGVLRS